MIEKNSSNQVKAMTENPYKYTGPLDPDKDKLVCVPRKDEVKKIVKGIEDGDYWAILGPRQIGKTTFFRQIEKSLSNAHYLYFDFEISPGDTDNFYQWMMEKFLTQISPGSTSKTSPGSKSYSPELRFLDFLKTFTPKNDDRKIVLLFDEIERVPVIKNFLHVWRKVYHERYYEKKLQRYSVIITGGADLIALTEGKTSPFNIAKPFYLDEISEIESGQLILEPLSNLNIEIESKAKERLASRLSGHPQLLQHTCHILVETINKQKKRVISEKEVDLALDALFKQSSNLDTFRHNLKINDILENLVRSILDDEKKKYHPYKEYSISGVGAIIDREGICTLRNKVYEQFARDILDISTEKHTGEDEHQPVSSQIFESEKELGKFDAFFVYNISDREMVETIGKKLAHRGINPWHDQLNLVPGRSIQDEISRLMTKINSLVVFIGRDKNVPWEEHPNSRILTQAVQRKIPVIPVILPNVDREPELPAFLKNLKWLKFEKDINDVNILDDLAYGITGRKPHRGIK